ncbi:MAG: fasciclin domain-containing protein [Chitinophagaceae bacterium]|nr:fasciclin domain-containing protein [Chitinophagaceae bacterium]
MRITTFCLYIPVLILLTFLCSCKKDHEAINAPTPSILEYIAKEPSLSLLNTAIGITRLDTVMSSGGPFTFFAATDPAFESAGFTGDSLRRMDPRQLQDILRYNIVKGRLSSGDVPGFLKQQFTGLHPLYRPYITKNYYGIFLNGIPVIKGNIELGDGVLQVTGRVAIPPAGSQLDVMNKEKDLSFLTAFVRNVYTFRTLVADSTYSLPPTGSGGLIYGTTLLAPTDSAFKAFGYADTTALINDSLKLVTGYYCNNCIPSYQNPVFGNFTFIGFTFTSDYKGQFAIGLGTNVILRSGSSSFWTSLDGFSFTGNGIAQNNPVRIIKPDMIATNGVVQKINQVFLVH